MALVVLSAKRNYQRRSQKYSYQVKNVGAVIGTQESDCPMLSSMENQTMNRWVEVAVCPCGYIERLPFRSLFYASDTCPKCGGLGSTTVNRAGAFKLDSGRKINRWWQSTKWELKSEIKGNTDEQ